MGSDDKGGAEEEEGKSGDDKSKRKEIGMPILVMKDRKSKMVYANVVPEKGRNKYAIKRLAQDIGILGYNRMIIKSDQEPSIMELKQCVKRKARTDNIGGGIRGVRRAGND